MVFGMLEDGDAPSDSLKSALQAPVHVEAVRKLVADPQVKSLLVQRYETKGM